MKLGEFGMAAAMLLAASLGLSLAFTPSPGDGAAGAGWSQWGQNPQHTGSVGVNGQEIQRTLAELAFDLLAPAQIVDPQNGGALSVHYQVPLVDGDDVFMEFKTGRYAGLRNWETQLWSERRLHWEDGQLVEKWSFQSDWKPVPFASARTGNGPHWEPVFHTVLAGGYVYVPGFAGRIYKLDRRDGSIVARIDPFGGVSNGSIFVAGPLSADSDGNVYYNAIRLDGEQPWDQDVVNAWLVKVRRDDSAMTTTFASLLASAATQGEPVPAAGDPGRVGFDTRLLPWPPAPDAVPPTAPCGSQRPGLNVAPAIAPDGTIYTVSRAHFTNRYGYLLAVNTDLTGRWAASLRGRLSDGCNDGSDPNVLLPPNGTPGGCRAGARSGVDPATNEPPPGRVLDDASSSPTVAPDGSILYGVYTRYNWAQGHLLQFSPTGEFHGAYPFGWDATPAIYAHDGTYSIVLKDNHYGGLGSYCGDAAACPSDRTRAYPTNPEAYFITQLDSRLKVEWRFQNINTLSCRRNADGSISCVSDHPNGFEWCVNAAAIDAAGVVYANSEDGQLYAISQGGTLKRTLLLDRALGAAYTPLSIGGDGKIYAENAGHLFALGQ
jgi:outer membrane protein assembly factor BamB